MGLSRPQGRLGGASRPPVDYRWGGSAFSYLSPARALTT